MTWRKHDYDDIPGTYVFNGERSNRGYNINKMAFSFNQATNREAFAQDMAAYCDQYGLNAEEKKAVLEADFLSLLKFGGNIYYLAKIAVFHGMSVQDACARMSQISTPEFHQRLQNNSIGFQEKINKLGGYFNG